MNYLNEFRLKSCRWIMRFEEASYEELAPFLKMNVNSDPLKDTRQLFLSFTGEEKINSHEFFETNELRIRRWSWIIDHTEYELLDVDSLPPHQSHGEIGMICIKEKSTDEYIPLCENLDCELEICLDKDHSLSNLFSERLEFFSALRYSLGPTGFDRHESDLETIYEFCQSSHGKEAILMTNLARENYSNAYAKILHDHQQLTDLYLSEFRLINSIKECPLESLIKIGYPVKTNSSDPWNKHIVIYIEWTPSETDHTYQLMYVRHYYGEDVYLLNSEGLIDRRIFTGDFCLSKHKKKITDLVLCLHKRAHSIKKFLYDCLHLVYNCS